MASQVQDLEGKARAIQDELLSVESKERELAQRKRMLRLRLEVLESALKRAWSSSLRRDGQPSTKSGHEPPVSAERMDDRTHPVHKAAAPGTACTVPPAPSNGEGGGKKRASPVHVPKGECSICWRKERRMLVPNGTCHSTSCPLYRGKAASRDRGGQHMKSDLTGLTGSRPRVAICGRREETFARERNRKKVPRGRVFVSSCAFPALYRSPSGVTLYISVQQLLQCILFLRLLLWASSPYISRTLSHRVARASARTRRAGEGLSLVTNRV